MTKSEEPSIFWGGGGGGWGGGGGVGVGATEGGRRNIIYQCERRSPSKDGVRKEKNCSQREIRITEQDKDRNDKEGFLYAFVEDLGRKGALL